MRRLSLGKLEARRWSPAYTEVSQFVSTRRDRSNKLWSGTGGATKEQVQHMVKTLLGLPGVPKEDAADALACGALP